MDKLWILQATFALRDGSDPIDYPSLVALEDRLRRIVEAGGGGRIDTYTITPGAARASLVEVLSGHVPDDEHGCTCGGVANGQSWPEHVAWIFEESTRAHATM